MNNMQLLVDILDLRLPERFLERVIVYKNAPANLKPNNTTKGNIVLTCFECVVVITSVHQTPKLSP